MTLGLVVQLNHRRGECPQRKTSTVIFTVYHTNGDHQVRVSYCGCPRATTDTSNVRLSQIFAQRWFPATWSQPRTVFTFDMLQQFHILNLQSKCNMYDYYRTILRIRNNAGVENQPVSLPWHMQMITQPFQNHYNEFSFVVRLWRHLKMLQRAGRMQDPGGVMNMGPGALVPECPACPFPERNLDEDWRQAPPSMQ